MGMHLANINQPKTKYDDENLSLDEEELFVELKEREISTKPLLAAAYKAKEQSEQRMETQLENTNQPRTMYNYDNLSLNEDELFADLRGTEIPAKPLLSAALKAKEQSDHRMGKHLENAHQPRTKYDDDNLSIDEDCLFDDKAIIPAKPVLAAAVKAQEAFRQESYSVHAIHLHGLNQPNALSEEKSMDEEDLFDNHLNHRPAKPLLNAAILAREQSKQEKYSLHAEHLKSLNQPKYPASEEKSIDEDYLFEEPSEERPRKPLLVAAYKAREEQRARVRHAGGNGSNTHHLQYINQPHARLEEDDAVSLIAVEVFDTPSPSIRKPLLTAAQLAKRQQEAERVPEHLRYLSQPQPWDTSNDECSLDLDEIFEPVKPPSPGKPLLAAATKAKEAAEVRPRIVGMSEDGTWISGEGSAKAARRATQRRPSARSADLVRKKSLDKSRSDPRKGTKKERDLRGSDGAEQMDQEVRLTHTQKKPSSDKSTSSAKNVPKSNKKDPSSRSGGQFPRLGGKKSN
jgi:hypothetical protein